MIDVVAAVLIKDSRILLAQRKCDDHAGKWEFPGGKIEQGESPQQALAREMNEEFGVDCSVGEYIGESRFDYGNKQIRLLAYFVEYCTGEFECREHAAIEWVKPEELKLYDLAEADIPLVESIRVKL